MSFRVSKVLEAVLLWSASPLGALVLAAVAAVIVIFYDRWYYSSKISPDGERYLAMSRGTLVPRPYSLRWLLPLLLKDRGWLWTAVNYWSLVCSSVMIALWSGGRWSGLFASLLFVGLTGIFRTSVIFPVLTDAVSFALALCSALMFRDGDLLSGVIFSCLAGACRESAPVFVACWTLEPLALIGVAAAGFLRPAAAPDHVALKAPFKDARDFHYAQGMEWQTLIRPWGAVLIVAALTMPFATPTSLFAAVLSLAVGYSQLLRARDSARLYQWSFPALAVLCSQVPESWSFLVLLAHFAILPRKDFI